jgi:hypothetical protein
MIKYFHELTKREINKLEGTVEQVSKDYPQPDWCEYPGAVAGAMGCWSLMLGIIHKKGKAYCVNCECCKPEVPE